MESRFLIDTNVLIYYFDDHIPVSVVDFVDEIFDGSFNISIITKIEFLGWPKFTEGQYRNAIRFVSGANVVSLSDEIVDAAIQVRRQKRVRLPDAVMAATCLVKHLTLVTRNSKDFDGLKDLAIYNPFEE